MRDREPYRPDPMTRGELIGIVSAAITLIVFIVGAVAIAKWATSFTLLLMGIK